MDDHEKRLGNLEKIVGQNLVDTGVLADCLTTQVVTTVMVIDLVREHLGLDNAEIRERALAFAADKGVDREGVVVLIAALLPDIPPLVPDARKRH